MTEFNDIFQNLEILAEEASEVIRIKSKIFRFGLTDYHYKNNKPNQEALNEEVGHFLCMVEILIHNGVLDRGLIRNSIKQKEKQLTEWYRESLCLCMSKNQEE